MLNTTVDQLICEIIRTAREPRLAEIGLILKHVATASFGIRPVRVRRRDRGLAYLGVTLGDRTAPLAYHLVKRVVGQDEKQWAFGTTADEYLLDMRQAARAPGAHLALYERNLEYLAAVIALTADAVPVERRGPGALPNILVVYSASRGRIVTGYQFSRLDALDIPEVAKWFDRPRTL